MTITITQETFQRNIGEIEGIVQKRKKHDIPTGFDVPLFLRPASCWVCVVAGGTVVITTHCETLPDGSESRDQNHGPPWLGRGLTETGTNLVFRFLAELWERWRCLTSLVCWNSSPWFVTNVHWSPSLIYWRGTQYWAIREWFIKLEIIGPIWNPNTLRVLVETNSRYPYKGSLDSSLNSILDQLFR